MAVQPGFMAPVSLKPMTCGMSIGDRLAQHGRFRFDAAHAPAQHAQAVDHGGVRVGADDGVGIGAVAAFGVVVEHNAPQVFEIHLVDDAGVRRHHLEIAERSLAPAQERVAFAVALEFDLVVGRERAGAAVVVHLHRVVDDQLGGVQRIDLLRIAAELLHGLAHGGEVHHAGHAGEVLHDHARGREIDLVGGRGLGVPAEHRFDVILRDVDAVFEAQQIFEQDLEGVGQSRDLVGGQFCEAPVVIGA